MKRISWILGLSACMISLYAFAEEKPHVEDLDHALNIDTKGQNSVVGSIAFLESRESGFTAVFMDVPIPDEGCDLADRAIIVGAQDEGGTLFNSAMTSLLHQKDTVIRVEGCVVIKPDSTGTAPRLVRILLRR